MVADEPVDPYKTMVASKDDIAAAMPKEFTDAASSDESESPQEEVLDLPKESDPKKTMYVSEEELRREMTGDDPGMEIPPKPAPPQQAKPTPEPSEPAKPTPPPAKPPAPPPAASKPPEPPKFSEPAASPPPSPFSTPPANKAKDAADESSAFSKTSPPIPSPFSEPKKPEPQAPKFEEPKTPGSGPLDAADASNPFDAPPKVKDSTPAEWTPPPAPDANWEKQEIGENTPFQPPAVESPNQIMAIVSLVFGILSVCCWVAPLTGIIALITGFLARKNIKADPAKYGGGTLALIGMILGGIFFLIGVAYYVLTILIQMGLVGGSLLGGF